MPTWNRVDFIVVARGRSSIRDWVYMRQGSVPRVGLFQAKGPDHMLPALVLAVFCGSVRQFEGRDRSILAIECQLSTMAMSKFLRQR